MKNPAGTMKISGESTPRRGAARTVLNVALLAALAVTSPELMVVALLILYCRWYLNSRYPRG